MTVVNLTIDGRPVSASAGSTVLRAAQSVGIDIPSLCDHPALAPIGACRVCLVEVKGQRVLQPACTFPVGEGMEVQTESAAVVQARKFVLDLLFAERNHYCMYCEMSGDCELQDLGYRYGLDHWVYPTYTTRFPVDATRQAFLMDHNRCILCRRCVRACAELVANHTLGVRERGAETMICADMNAPFGESSCISCGTCLQVCPTGALVDKRSAFMGRRVQTDQTRSTCSQCSVGCAVQVITRGGGVLRVEGDWTAAPNWGLLCQKGRFDPLYDQRQRVTHPMVRRKGRLEAVDWDVALEIAAEHLRDTPVDRLGVIVSTTATNEALYVVGALFREGLGVGNVALLNGTLPVLLEPQGTLGDVSEADLIVVIGADPVAEQPVASFLIKRASDQGARLVVVGEEESALATLADRHYPCSRAGEAADLAARAQRPVVVYGSGLSVEAARTFQKLERAVFVALDPGVNTRAAVAFGLNRGFESEGSETAFVLLGEEARDGTGRMPLLGDGVDSIVQASYMSPLVERAVVVLPAAIWSERSGTLTNCEGLVLPLNRAVEPAGEAKADWQILTMLASRLGKQVPDSLAALTALAAHELTR